MFNNLIVGKLNLSSIEEPNALCFRRDITSKRASFFVFLALALVFLLFVPNEAYAEKKSDKKYANVKTQKRHSVGRKCGKKLEKSQDEMEVEQWIKAESTLKGALPKVCGSSYEKSQVWNYLAYVFYSNGKISQAIDAYKKVISEPATDERTRVNSYYSIAQLFFVKENYSKAAQFLEKWMKESTVVGADGKILLAQAYYQLNRKKEALNLVDRTIKNWEIKGKVPKENWWSLQRVMYYEKNNYAEVVVILKKLIKHYSRVTYWKQLGSIYGELNQDLNQLISTEVVYLLGDIKKEKELLGFASLFIAADAPYLAARVVDKGISQGVIEVTAKNMEFLGYSWELAQNGKKARVSLEKAAKLSDQGKIWARLATVYLDIGADAQAVQAARMAIKKGGLRRSDVTNMVLGNAQLNLHCYGSAIKAFRKAAKDKRSRKSANQWIQYADKENGRRSKLRQVGASLAGCVHA